MKQKMIATILALTLFSQVAACAETKEIRGVEYDTYGFINDDEVKNPEIQYKVCWGNAFWGIFLFQTIIGPIYFFGYSLFEPVGVKPPIKGAVAQ